LSIQKLSIDERQYSMNNTGENIRKRLRKRQWALLKFKVRREYFLLFREQMKNDIEQARKIWIETLDQLPKNEFN